MSKKFVHMNTDNILIKMAKNSLFQQSKAN